ncbi:hypothetical protein CSUI_000497, partial [Cystoisospora suis]
LLSASQQRNRVGEPSRPSRPPVLPSENRPPKDFSSLISSASPDEGDRPALPSREKPVLPPALSDVRGASAFMSSNSALYSSSSSSASSPSSSVCGSSPAPRLAAPPPPLQAPVGSGTSGSSSPPCSWPGEALSSLICHTPQPSSRASSRDCSRARGSKGPPPSSRRGGPPPSTSGSGTSRGVLSSSSHSSGGERGEQNKGYGYLSSRSSERGSGGGTCSLQSSFRSSERSSPYGPRSV